MGGDGLDDAAALDLAFQVEDVGFVAGLADVGGVGLV